MLETSLWYYFLRFYYSALPVDQQAQMIASAMVTFGMGASAMALFARVGGGIFTKAADVGADLVGKVEAGIPEDDPRNPAVIADNVGDNVGDVAGMGADLYESYSGARLSAAALAVSAGFGFTGMALPMALAAIGIFASIIGSFFVKTNEDASQKQLLSALRRGTYISWRSGCHRCFCSDLLHPGHGLHRPVRCNHQRSGCWYPDRLLHRVLHFGYLQAHPEAGWHFS